MDPSPGVHANDEQLARSLQLALDMEARDEARVAATAAAAASSNNGTVVIVGQPVQHPHPNYRSSRHQSRKEWASENGYADPRALSSPGSMLFVTCEIDGRLVQLFVDSGASCSVMTLRALKSLGLEHKLRKNLSGTAGGVGSANIVGVVENVQCTVGHVEFLLFFVVLDSPNFQIIFGLDQLKRFRCLIDLDEYELIFGGKNGVSVPFLSEELAAEAAEIMAGNATYPTTTTTTRKAPEQLPAATTREKVVVDNDATRNNNKRRTFFGRKKSSD